MEGDGTTVTKDELETKRAWRWWLYGRLYYYSKNDVAKAIEELESFSRQLLILRSEEAKNNAQAEQ